MTNRETEPGHRIEDFLETEIDSHINHYKGNLEKASWVMYLFAIFVLFFYLLSVLINFSNLEWLNVAINIVVITFYFCLAWYCQYKPFTSFIAMLAILLVVLLTDMFIVGTVNTIGLIAKISLMIYLCTMLGMAKKVQDHESQKTAPVR